MKTVDSKVLELIKQRYTVRSFKPTPVPENFIYSILEAGLNAPSKQDKFPYRIRVISTNEKSKQMREKLVEYTSCFLDIGETQIRQYINEVRTAPISFLFTLKPVPEPWEEGEIKNEKSAVLRSTRDAMIAVVFMLLRGLELGLGTACTGCFSEASRRMDQFRKDLELEADEEPCIILSFGYPEEESQEISPDKIPRFIDAMGNVRFAKDLRYVDPENPAAGVQDVYNRGPRPKHHPPEFVKFY